VTNTCQAPNEKEEKKSDADSALVECVGHADHARANYRVYKVEACAEKTGTREQTSITCFGLFFGQFLYIFLEFFCESLLEICCILIK
jgi:hypothetical protein